VHKNRYTYFWIFHAYALLKEAGDIK